MRDKDIWRRLSDLVPKYNVYLYMDKLDLRKPGERPYQGYQDGQVPKILIKLARKQGNNR